LFIGTIKTHNRTREKQSVLCITTNNPSSFFSRCQSLSSGLAMSFLTMSVLATWSRVVLSRDISPYNSDGIAMLCLAFSVPPPRNMPENVATKRTNKKECTKVSCANTNAQQKEFLRFARDPTFQKDIKRSVSFAYTHVLHTGTVHILTCSRPTIIDDG